MDTEKRSGGGRQSKVAEVIERYGLDGIGATLETRWTAESTDERHSLRELADLFNKRVLQSVVVDANVQLVGVEVDGMYQALTDSSATPSEQTQARRRLEREDVDVDGLRDDFVSYQAIRTYLTKYRDAEYNRDVDQLEAAIGTINRLQARLEAVASDRLSRLCDKDSISLGEFTVIVNVEVICEDCGQQRAMADLLAGGSCNC